MAISYRVLTTALGLLIFAVCAPPSGADDKAAEFFRGKTVTYIVFTAPGGGHDFYGRLAARPMERFLPGIIFVVRNVLAQAT